MTEPHPADLRIGGLAPFSTVDWPDHMAATVFLQGCPWRCPYCHNAHLRPAQCGEDGGLTWDEVLTFLRRRQSLLDAVVFSGGEPTLQRALGSGIRAVRGLGFSVGLHTAGPWPERLAAVVASLDWVGFDVKAPFEDYDALTGVPGSGDRVRASLRILIDSGVPFEARTTLHPMLMDDAGLDRLASILADMGVRHVALQHARPTAILPADAQGRPFPTLSRERAAAFDSVVVRGA